jgi:poly(A) polymerase
LRILRFFRFHAELNVREFDADALAACKAMAGQVAGLSGERISAEMLKLLAAPALSPALFEPMAEVLAAAGLPSFPGGLAQGDAWDRLAGWLLLADAPPGPLAARWKLSGTQAALLSEVIALARKLSPELEPPVQKKLLRAAGKERFLRAINVASLRDDAPYRAMRLLAESWKIPAFPVSGADLLARGYAEGRALGEALTLLEARWEAADYVPGKEELLKHLPPV